MAPMARTLNPEGIHRESVTWSWLGSSQKCVANLGSLPRFFRRNDHAVGPGFFDQIGNLRNVFCLANDLNIILICDCISKTFPH
jgi:hypothetical protein